MLAICVNRAGTSCLKEGRIYKILRIDIIDYGVIVQDIITGFIPDFRYKLNRFRALK